MKKSNIYNSLQDIKSHKLIASDMNKFQLSDTIKELLEECTEMYNYISHNELEAYHELIQIYSEELENRVGKCDGLSHRNYSQQIH